MTNLRANQMTEDFGKFQVIASTPRGKTENISLFRGAAIQVSDLTSRDPFGDATCNLQIPQVTIFDQPGQGDLFWLKPYTNIDIRVIPFQPVRKDVPDTELSNSEIVQNYIEGIDDNPIPGMEPPTFYHVGAHQYDKNSDVNKYPIKKWRWEGYIASWDISTQSGLSITCKGALYQLDNYLAKPDFPKQAIPYEILLTRAFKPSKHPGLLTNPLQVEFPDNWSKKAGDGTSQYLDVYGISKGDKWSGLASRSTGAWDPTLTGFCQELLSVMFTTNGRQWTIYKLPGRTPILKLRREPTEIERATLTIKSENPGVDLSITRDFTQSVNMIYGTGKDLAGVAFSGQKITPDGRDTYYQPFASAAQVYPPTKDNKYYDPFRSFPKEGLLQFPQGLNELDARDVAEQQFQRFADPGYTGTITLKTDPKYRGYVFPRYLIQAGMSIAVKNIMGNKSIVFHIVECSVDLEGGTVTLSVDSKFRDYLTWSEVRARTRDALIPLRSLKVGEYSNILQDLLKPWSNRDGSGVVPSGKHYDATRFFNEILPTDAKFPYEEWTKKHPPSAPHSRGFYMKVPQANKKNANDNWGADTRAGKKAFAFPVKAAQAANIRLTQIAAYDRAGNVKKVPFHISFYLNNGTNVQSMPRIPAETRFPEYYRNRGYEYEKGQHYPFFRDAWETVNADGETIDQRVYGTSADPTVGWGNFFEPAGYWPGLKSKNGKPTGRLVDEAPWSFDCTSQPGWDPYNKHKNMTNPNVGVLFCMIFCDADPDEATYFLGRFFREEPGTA